jgi:hypothetical protein
MGLRLVTLVGAGLLLTVMLIAPMTRAVVTLPSAPPLPSLPLPSLPLPSLVATPAPSSLPSLPLPSVLTTPRPSVLPSLPLPSVLPTPLPTVPPFPTPTTAATSPPSRPFTVPGPTESSEASGAPSKPSDRPGPSAPNSVAPTGTKGPVLVDDPSPPGGAGALDGLVLPGLVLGVPTLVVIGFLVAQALGGIALLPALRRTLGSLGLRNPSAGVVPTSRRAVRRRAPSGRLGGL